MKIILEIIKGVHPGKFLEQELKKNNYNNRQFVLSIAEHSQTLGSIINGKSRMNIDLSLKTEKKLHLKEGFLMTLQVHYDIKLAKFEPNYKPDLTKIRNRLFWDGDINKID